MVLYEPSVGGDGLFHLSREEPATHHHFQHCHYIKGLPCPPDKESYWRQFTVNFNPSGCGKSRRICEESDQPIKDGVGSKAPTLEIKSIGDGVIGKEQLIKFL